MANLGEQLLNALTLAGLLFLVSAGLSLVFGILRVVNFAHGVFYMLGAYLGYTTVMLSGWFWPALVIVPPVVGALGALLESSTLRFIYRRPPIYQLLLTFGLALILEEALRIPLRADGEGHRSAVTTSRARSRWASLLYPRYRLFVVVLSLVVARGRLALSSQDAGRPRHPGRRPEQRDGRLPRRRRRARPHPRCSAPPARSPGSAAWRRRP